MMADDQLALRHIRRSFSKFSELRNQANLVDFTIHVGDKKLRVHKVILAASSDYFKAMFSHNLKELNEGEVFLKEIDADAVESIVDYIYTTEIDLNEDNIEKILSAASILQVEAIIDKCVQFIQEHIDASNCLGVAALYERCNLSDLYQKTLCYCYANFEKVVCEKEFSTIDESMLTHIISDDKLDVDGEKQVFQSIITWIKADEEQRLPKLNQLMKHVRFATVDPLTLFELENNDLIQASRECLDLIHRAKNYLLISSKNYPTSVQERYREGLLIRPRNTRKRIYAVGGWADEYKSIVSAEIYDPNTDTWTEIAPMAQKRCGVGLSGLHDSVYAVGGHDGQNYLNTVERYDIKRGKWFNDVANMRYERSSIGVVTLDGYIYAIGGQLGNVALDKVERYDPIRNIWEECAPMNVKRLGVGVAVFEGCIYVMGGSEGGSDIHSSVEKYDPKQNKWTYLSPMSTARKHLGSCTCEGFIFAVGGRNNTRGELDSAEIYNPALDKWTDIANMHQKRCGIGLVELCGHVYAIGGQNQDARLSEVEAYDPVSKCWSWKTSMKYSRLGGGMTVHPIHLPSGQIHSSVARNSRASRQPKISQERIH
jgi:N-acetylneuraminic acid mutarotase